MESVPLQVRDEAGFQRREWKFVRAGWALMALFVLAASGGLLGGPGPLSWAQARSPQGLFVVEYQRFAHVQADDLMTVTLEPAAVTGDSADVQLDGDWVRSVEITSVTPQPTEQVSTPYGLRLVLPVEGGAVVPIQIAFRASDLGWSHGGVRVENETVSFRQFVFP